MKKTILHSILFAILCLGLQSCLFDEKDDFSNSAANRQTEVVEKYSSLLKSASNGWKLEYYVGTDYAYGGFPILLKFTDKDVEMASTCGVPSVPAGTVVKSLYTLGAEQETLLSFDTFNEILHYFAQPSGSGADPNANYEGDYEFIIRRATEDSIYLEGKKYKNQMVMTRVDDAVKWSDYIKAVNTVEDNASFYYYSATDNGTSKGIIQREGYSIYYQPTEADTTYVRPFTYTDKGIKLHEPLDIGGKSVQNFTWDNTNHKFVCSDDSGKDVQLEGILPKTYQSYESFIGTYTLTGHTLNTDASGRILGFDKDIKETVQIKALKAGETYQMKVDNLPITLAYDKGLGALRIESQGLGAYEFSVGTFYIGVQAAFCRGGSSIAYASKVLTSDIDKTMAIGIPTSTSPLTVSFNKMGSYTGFMLYVYSDAAYTNMYGIYDWLTEIELVKQ